MDMNVVYFILLNKKKEMFSKMFRLLLYKQQLTAPKITINVSNMTKNYVFMIYLLIYVAFNLLNIFLSTVALKLHSYLHNSSLTFL